jgi:predicted permease
LLFGIVPSIQLAREGVAGSLKTGGRTVSQQGLRRTLAGVELALAFVLVVSATLLLRSFVALVRTDPGFKSAGVLTATVGLPAVRYETKNAVAFYDRVAAQLRTLPGVQFAGFTSDLPWSGYDENSNFGIVGRSFSDNHDPEGRYHFVTPGVMRALGIPLVAGRDLTAGDTADAPAVVLINERLARLYWTSGEAAIGAQLDLWGAKRTVVGVVGDVRDQPADERAAAAFYFPQAQQWYSQDMVLAVRTAGDPLSLAEPLRRIVHDADPEIPLANVQPLDAVARAAMSARSFTLSLVAVFGGASLFLAVVGVYGVMAQGVAQRAREFGLRQALGAAPSDILRLVLSNGLAIGAVGVLTGLALAFVSTRWMASLLYHVKPIDPWTFGAVAALVFSVAAAASYIPARRATRIDPMVALRYE